MSILLNRREYRCEKEGCFKHNPSKVSTTGFASAAFLGADRLVHSLCGSTSGSISIRCFASLQQPVPALFFLNLLSVSLKSVALILLALLQSFPQHPPFRKKIDERSCPGIAFWH